jgi:germination protein M
VLPIAREVPHTVAVARAALQQLFAGPTSAETGGVPAISTAIPSGVRLLGLTIGENIATVDVSSEFAATEDSAAVAQRAAQVVFTLSRFDSVAEVLFRQEGKPVSIQIGDGSLDSRPVGIWDYLEFAPAISVESPVYGGPAGDPLRVTGFGAVFEATFQYALTDDDGLILQEGIAMTNNGTGWGGFDFTIDYDVDRQQVGALIVWAHSANDGSQIDVREYPVLLTP